MLCVPVYEMKREILFCHQIYDDSGDYLIYYKYVVLKSTYMSDGRLSLFCLYYLYILTSLVRSLVLIGASHSTINIKEVGENFICSDHYE